MDHKQLRLNFIAYLKANYQFARPDIMASNVFYAYHNDIGIEFLDIFRNDINMSAAKALLERKFVQVSRKDPRGHTNVHYYCWLKFKDFIDSVYGGAQNIEIY